jgi:protein phosphatase PTC7
VRQAASIPDPIKKAGGEDAHFILETKNRYAVGVADGVGGWSEVGVDSGIYSRSLMNKVILKMYLVRYEVWIANELVRSIRPRTTSRPPQYPTHLTPSTKPGETSPRSPLPCLPTASIARSRSPSLRADEPSSQLKGSATACVCVLHKDQLRTLNVGDSGFLLLRPTAVVSGGGPASAYVPVYKSAFQQLKC